MKKIIAYFKGIFNLILFGLVTLAAGIVFLLPFFLFKLLLYPFGLADYGTRAMEVLQQKWGRVHKFLIEILCGVKVKYHGPQLSPDRWYILISNHQSWVDILLLHTIFDRAPPFKFFVKQQTIWIPIIGIACWAMGFPFMRRYSKEAQLQHPEKKGLDVKTTQEKCQAFLKRPTALINFVEGTRATVKKRALDGGGYQHLLTPKSGGVGFALAVMHQEVKEIIDLTIIYKNNHSTMWDLCTGNMAAVKIEACAYPANVLDGRGLMQQNPEAIKQLKTWLDERWKEKDKRLEKNSGYSQM